VEFGRLWSQISGIETTKSQKVFVNVLFVITELVFKDEFVEQVETQCNVIIDDLLEVQSTSPAFFLNYELTLLN